MPKSFRVVYRPTKTESSEPRSFNWQPSPEHLGLLDRIRERVQRQAIKRVDPTE